MEKIKWSENVTNEEVLERIGEKRTLLNNILSRKANWISLSIEHKGEIQVIFHKSIDLVIS